MLARTPALSLIVIMSLALGIGANTAIYSLIQQILYRQLPVTNAEELVYLYHPGPLQGRVSSNEDGGAVFSEPMFRDLAKTQTPFTGIAASRSVGASIAYKGQSKGGDILLVSGSYFPLLGARPALGRLLSEEDDKQPGGHAVVVLNHGYWVSSLGAKPEVLNQTLIVNGHPMTIVGVAPPLFESEHLGQDIDAYVPVMMKAQMTPRWDGLGVRKDYWLSLLARRKPGITTEQAQLQINVAYKASLDTDIKQLNRPSPQVLERFNAKQVLLREGGYGRGSILVEARVPLFLLLGITGFVLLIACANAANLMLARATARRKEIAIRLSIGASRGRLIRQLLAEACVLSLAGGVLGLVVSQWTLDGLLGAIPDSAITAGFLASELDVPMLLYCLAASLLTGLLFGIFPAIQATRGDVTPSLKDQGDLTGGHGAARWFRSALVSGQVALSLMMLVTSGLLTVSLWKLTRVDVGMNTDNVITFGLNPALSGYEPERSRQFFDELERRLAALPGVRSLSASTVQFLTGDNWSSSITVEGYTNKGDGDGNSKMAHVGPGFFSTMGIALRNGREFSERDSAGSPQVAIVNESFAKHYLEGRNPLGARFDTTRGQPKTLRFEIVGVVQDTKYSGLNNELQPLFYLPYRQNEDLTSLLYYVRTSIPPDQVQALIRREVAALDPTMPLGPVQTMERQVAEAIFAERLMSVASATFAGLATILAAIGLYGVLAYTVARRTREIGIRMALGAQAGTVRAMVLREVAVLAGFGVAAGLAGAFVVAKFIESQLYSVKSSDPVVVGGATMLLLTVTLIAGYFPARRATKIDPQTALRDL
jgi:predicted permease